MASITSSKAAGAKLFKEASWVCGVEGAKVSSKNKLRNVSADLATPKPTASGC